MMAYLIFLIIFSAHESKADWDTVPFYHKDPKYQVIIEPAPLKDGGFVHLGWDCDHESNFYPITLGKPFQLSGCDRVYFETKTRSREEWDKLGEKFEYICSFDGKPGFHGGSIAEREETKLHAHKYGPKVDDLSLLRVEGFAPFFSRYQDESHFSWFVVDDFNLITDYYKITIIDLSSQQVKISHEKTVFRFEDGSEKVFLSKDIQQSRSRPWLPAAEEVVLGTRAKNGVLGLAFCLNTYSRIDTMLYLHGKQKLNAKMICETEESKAAGTKDFEALVGIYSLPASIENIDLFSFEPKFIGALYLAPSFGKSDNQLIVNASISEENKLTSDTPGFILFTEGNKFKMWNEAWSLLVKQSKENKVLRISEHPAFSRGNILPLSHGISLMEESSAVIENQNSGAKNSNLQNEFDSLLLTKYWYYFLGVPALASIGLIIWWRRNKKKLSNK